MPPNYLFNDLFVGEPGSVAARMAASRPNVDATEPRTRAWRAAEIPAANGQGNARSMARIHSVLACGGAHGDARLLSEKMLARVLEQQIEGNDLALNVPACFGMGYGLPGELMPLPNERVFFWGGWGGSIALVDLDARMSVAYAMNRMFPDPIGDMLAADIVTAAYASLATMAAAGLTTG